MNDQLPATYYRALHELQSIDFVLTDLTLYLDTHPSDTQALAQYQQFKDRREVLAKQFEQNPTPLTSFGGHDGTHDSWQWNNTPWPWQV